MVCLGFEPRAAGWKARTNPLSYGGTLINYIVASILFLIYSSSTLVERVKEQNWTLNILNLD